MTVRKTRDGTIGMREGVIERRKTERVCVCSEQVREASDDKEKLVEDGGDR